MTDEYRGNHNHGDMFRIAFLLLSFFIATPAFATIDYLGIAVGTAGISILNIAGLGPFTSTVGLSPGVSFDSHTESGLGYRFTLNLENSTAMVQPSLGTFGSQAIASSFVVSLSGGEPLGEVRWSSLGIGLAGNSFISSNSNSLGLTLPVVVPGLAIDFKGKFSERTSSKEPFPLYLQGIFNWFFFGQGNFGYITISLGWDFKV